jgi:hypothetical protein
MSVWHCHWQLIYFRQSPGGGRAGGRENDRTQPDSSRKASLSRWWRCRRLQGQRWQRRQRRRRSERKEIEGAGGGRLPIRATKEPGNWNSAMFALNFLLKYIGVTLQWIRSESNLLVYFAYSKCNCTYLIL